jgi:MFS family permease
MLKRYFHTKKFSKNPQTESSLRHSLRDGVAYSLMTGSLETYISAYALFLKASAPQVALIATLPAALGALAQLFSAWLGHQINQRKPIMVSGAYFQSLSLPCLILLPLLPQTMSVICLAVLLLLYFFAAHIVVPQWCSLMGELVPERKRGRYFGLRTRLATAASFTGLMIGGLLLGISERYAFAWLGFGAIFVFAFIARLYSAYQLQQMHEPVAHAVSLESSLDLRWLKAREFKAARSFSTFVVLMNFAVAIASPFFAVYMLKDLHYSYFQFMVNTGTAVLMQVLTLNYWGRINDAFGSRAVLIVCGSLVPTLPLLWLFSTNFWYLLFIQLLAGIAWGGFSLSSSNALYDLIPQAKRSTYQALHNVSLAIGIFLGGMVGVGLIKLLPQTVQVGSWQWHWHSVLLWTFLVSSFARTLIAVIFIPRLHLFGRPRKNIAVSQLVFRFTRFNAFMGLAYEVVARDKKRSQAGSGNT